MGFAIGINATVAFHLGQKNGELADRSVSSGTMLSVIHGFILTAVCIAVMPWLLSMFTDDAAITNYGIEYSQYVFLLHRWTACIVTCEKIFQSTGRMKTTMFCLAAGCITNIILDRLMILQHRP
ncbi:MAG: MATE family efflux transporter [Clostridia bacterium]